MSFSDAQLRSASSRFRNQRAGKHVIASETGNIERYLKELPQFLRMKVIKEAVRAGARIVANDAKKRVPVGNPSHRPDKKPLKSSIAVTLREYGGGRRALGVVGPRWPEGAHGHLVEYGHKVIVSRGPRKGSAPLTGSPNVAGKEYLQPAVDSTRSQQRAAVVSRLKKAVTEHKQKVGNG